MYFEGFEERIKFKLYHKVKALIIKFCLGFVGKLRHAINRLFGRVQMTQILVVTNFPNKKNPCVRPFINSSTSSPLKRDVYCKQPLIIFLFLKFFLTFSALRHKRVGSFLCKLN